MQSYVADVMAPTRFSLILMGIFGLVALVLAAIGLYGVISYLVSQRTQEIGIRMAFGAQPLSLLKHIVGQGLVLALFGVGLGVPFAFVLTRLMANLLYGVTPTNPLTFVSVPLLLLFVVLWVCFIPAWRATKLDPMVVLRGE